jgi:hypothetical protein
VPDRCLGRFQEDWQKAYWIRDRLVDDADSQRRLLPFGQGPVWKGDLDREKTQPGDCEDRSVRMLRMSHRGC